MSEQPYVWHTLMCHGEPMPYEVDYKGPYSYNYCSFSEII